MILLAYVLGFLAAAGNAGSNILQRAANRDQNEDQQFSLQLIKNLLHTKKWFAGILCMAASFFLQAIGLGLGSLSAVEPLLVLELPMTMVAARLWLGAHLGRRGWVSIVGMTLSTIALIAFLGPGRGRANPASWYIYLLAIIATAGVVVTCYVLGVRWKDPNRRGAILGIGTGTAYGLAASLTKGMTEQFSSGGMAGVFTSWQLWSAIAVGAFAVWMHQNAVSSARLVVAQPGITLADPYLSIIWGAAVFAEPMRGGWWILPAIAAGVGMTVSAIELSRAKETSGHFDEGRARADR
ncbi:MAG TPA: DMT family transporter [Acidimicrobiales bacterium]|nr:DMT family transporter [Acidimicrobiales bacterium]